jgi:hypothetical protein
MKSSGRSPRAGSRGPDGSTPRAALSLELERLALRAVRGTYDDLNRSLFRGALRTPAFELTDPEGRLGRWVGDTRTLELSRRLLAEKGWGVVVEVLKHEMAHQYVHEILGAPAAAAHGPEFRRVCAERNIDARAAGAPARPAGEAHVLDRIAKLLALAESPNEHEAQAAMSAAQRLMLKYNVEAVERGVRASYGFEQLGAPSGRIGESQRQLAALLAEFFFVEVIWVPVWRVLEGKRGSVLEVSGTPENLELAAYVHAFVTHTGQRLLADDAAKRGKLRRGERERFLSGLVTGFREKLAGERRKSAAEGLVYRGDAELHGFFRGRHPRVRFTRHHVTTSGEAYTRGREAGARLVLHRGVRGAAPGSAASLATGPKRAPVRLLPAKR